LKKNRLSESVTALIGPSAKSVLAEKDKIDYDATKAPNFSSDNQPGGKKKKKKKDGDDD